jgi:hypothetical protein
MGIVRIPDLNSIYKIEWQVVVFVPADYKVNLFAYARLPA